VAGVGVATAMMVSALSISHGYERTLAHDIEMMGYQVLITGKGCPHEAATLILRGGSIPMYIDNRVYQHIMADPDVADATRFFMQSLPGDEPGSFQLYTGIDDRFLELKPEVTFLQGGRFDSDVSEQVILGYNVAEYRRLDTGDTVTVLGRDLSVQGILDKLGTQSDGTIFLPILTAQQLFDKRDRLTGMGVRLTDMNRANAFIDRVYELPGTQVITMSQVQRTILNILNSVRALLFTITAMGLAVAGLGVLNVSLMSVQEQRVEMGVSRALGCAGSVLFKLVWAESFILTAAGAVLGCLLTFLLRGVVEGFIQQVVSFAPAGRIMTMTPTITVGSCLAVTALGLLGGVYPAWRASIIPPLTSIRGAA
jgi:putative ABC transport system permease protein